MHKLCFILAAYFSLPAAQAQPDSLAQKPVPDKDITFSGGVDVYYAFDFSRPADRNRLYTTQAFRHNEFNLNFGFLQAAYAADNVRATLALHTGTYVQSNYAAEPNELTRMILQANVGVRLREKVWLDVGIMPSHIGYESTFSLENEIYTRALMAENSPYYETGARLTAEVSEKVTLKLLVLNGWQNIQETNSAKSLGFAVAYAPSEQLELSYSNYYGNEAPDGMAPRRRFFHNMYARYAFSGSFSMAGSVDYGRQERFDSNRKGSWYAGLLLARYRLNNRFAVAGRVEHYHDAHQLIVATGTAHGFRTSSTSLNLDYIPAPNMRWRFEARGYNSRDNIFIGERGEKDKNLLLVSSLALTF